MPDRSERSEIERQHQRLQLTIDAALAQGDLSADQVQVVLGELGTALEELRVAGEELTTQSDQLAASAEAIDAERERYAELFEFAPDAYVETDGLGKIVEANQAAAHLLGVVPRHLRGKLLVSFVATEERSHLRQVLRDAAEVPVDRELVFRMVARDEREVVVGVTVARQLHPSTESLQLRWLLRDITERLKLRAQVDELTEEVGVLNEAATIQRLVGSGDPLASTLDRVVRAVARMLPQTEVGMSLVGRRDLERELSSGDRAAELDVRQREAGDGPCVHALRTGTVVRARPADWASIADAHDVVEVVGVPFTGAEDVAGALNVYAFERDLTDRDIRLLETFGEQASVALANASLYTASAHLADGLSRALETRGVIERAKGMLMAREDIDADAAFDLLRRASQRENVKLHEVAARIVTASSHPG